MQTRKKLGEIFIEKGILSSLTVKRMLAQASRLQKRFGWLLEDKGLITGDELASALAEQYGLKHLLKIAQYNYPRQLLNLISPEVAIEFHVFPLRQEGDKLLMAVTDPTDMDLVKNIIKNNGLNPLPAVVSRKDFFDAYCKHYLGTLPADTKSNTILVAEDDLMTQEMLKQMLESNGYRVLLAGNGMDAYRDIVANRPRVVLTDKEMPVLDGFGLLKLVRAIREFKSIPIILVSDKITDEEEAHMFDQGFFDFIPKPIKATMLLARVKRAMEMSESSLENQ